MIMKKNLFYLFAIVCSMSLFAACSDDDGDDKDYASAVVGDYAGTMTITAGQEIPPMSKTINITRLSDGKANVKVAGFSIPVMMPTPTDINAECAVAPNGSNYALTGSTKVSVPLMGEVPATVTGTVSGKTLTLNITVPGAISVAFTGTK